MAECNNSRTWYNAVINNQTKVHDHFYKTILPRDRVVVLMYHDIVSSKKEIHSAGDVSFYQFKTQMNFMKKKGYTPISVSDYHKYLGGEIPHLPVKPFIVTMDDGYSGNCKSELIDFLLDEEIPTTFFVHTKYVGVGKHPNRPYSKSRCSYADWQRVINLNPENSPLFSVQSHTVSHKELGSIQENQFQRVLKLDNPKQKLICSNYSRFDFSKYFNTYKLDLELFCSRQSIENNLFNYGANCAQYVTSIAYPRGDYNTNTIQFVKKYYGLGFTVAKSKKITNFNIPRFGVGSRLSHIHEFEHNLNLWKKSLDIRY